ncbi:MAG: FadR family transcriptional regulator [Deltaproteobacteria bacterium]|nr:FadR family transcriptional regulator [Deltaproteobacteria bacterium]
MVHLYRSVNQKKAADLVFEQIRDLIYVGQVKPGDQLPPERELAETMGVSRPTIREAVGKLVNLGLLEPHQGQGTFVRSFSKDQNFNPLKALVQDEEGSAQHLLEVRLGLECNAAVLAARRATEEDIALLEESLASIRKLTDAGQTAYQEDVYFHMRIAYASKNPVQINLMKHFYDLLLLGIRDNLVHLYRDPGNKHLIRSQHESIFYAIKSRDTQAAFDAMRQHIVFVMESVKDGPPSAGIARKPNVAGPSGQNP